MSTTTSTVQETRRQQAESRLLVIRNAFEVADEELERAFVERDWEVLGHDSWESYCAAMPGYRHFKMKVGPRRDRVAALRAQGANIPQLKAATGASVGTIHNDLALLEGGHRRESVSVLKDEPAESPVPAPPVYSSTADRAVALVAAQGARGMTVKELGCETGWHHGQSSGALSRAHRKLGRIKPTGEFRDRCGIYVAL